MISQLKSPSKTGEITPSSLENTIDIEISELDKAISALSDVPKSTCRGCAKSLYGPVVSVPFPEGVSQYHEKCCRCAVCCKVLAGGMYALHDSTILCVDCWDTKNAYSCIMCGQKIKHNDEKVQVREESMHSKCFLCAHCGTSLHASEFYTTHDRNYCTSCYVSLFAEKCGKCHQGIVGEFVQSPTPYHPGCFTCVECSTSLVSTAFYPYDSQLYCSLHYHTKLGLLCAACDGILTGKCITISQKDGKSTKRFHASCFKCGWCSKALEGTEWQEVGNVKTKIFCYPCALKLEG